MQRAFYPTAQAAENERCPVADHRPLEMKQPDSLSFLAINNRRQPSSQIWYSKAALGKERNWEVSFEGCESCKTVR